MADTHKERQPLGSPGPEALVRAAQRLSTAPLRKRFYKEVAVGAAGVGFAVMLDGRQAKTPGGHGLAVSSHVLAEALAAEWAAQGGALDPVTMPLTRLVNSALDGVAREMAAARAEIVKFAGSDLICYRAGEPASLAAAQALAWDPILDFVHSELGARFVLGQGIVFTAQPARAVAAVSGVVDGYDDAVALAALNAVTTLTGSALIALALGAGFFDTRVAWAAAHVDEDFQWRLWGADDEALARRDARWVEMRAAGRVLPALSPFAAAC